MTGEHVGLLVACQTQLKISGRRRKCEGTDRTRVGPNEDRPLGHVDRDRGQSDGEGNVEQEVAGGQTVDFAGLIFRDCEDAGTDTAAAHDQTGDGKAVIAPVMAGLCNSVA